MSGRTRWDAIMEELVGPDPRQPAKPEPAAGLVRPSVNVVFPALATQTMTAIAFVNGVALGVVDDVNLISEIQEADEPWWQGRERRTMSFRVRLASDLRSDGKTMLGEMSVIIARGGETTVYYVRATSVRWQSFARGAAVAQVDAVVLKVEGNAEL